ncbi:MAG: hypothetical protein JWN00_750 [Actinomycetia bacterium]|nr:hypothetical protein [Actinomycetes bacterium]
MSVLVLNASYEPLQQVGLKHAKPCRQAFH